MSEWCLQADTDFNECIEMSVKFNQITDQKKNWQWNNFEYIH